MSQLNIDHFPFWSQILISVIIGVGTLVVASFGYFKKKVTTEDSIAADKGVMALAAASLQDMAAVRHLADVCIRLTGAVERLCNQLKDNEHETRNTNDLLREECARLRELREALEREVGRRH